MIKKPDTPKDDEVVIVAEEPDVHSAVTREVRTEDFSVMPEELIEPADPPVDPTADTGLVVDPSLVGTDDFDDPDETENLRGQQQVGAEDLPAAEADDPENTDQTENLRAQQQEEVEGQVIDNRYRITETLGSGGMGKVHRAVDLNLEGKKSVAIKILRANFSKDKTHRKRFEREIDALSTLKNDYIVDIHNRGTTEGGRLFFVMEDLKGISLSGALNDITLDSETFTWKRTKKIILQI